MGCAEGWMKERRGTETSRSSQLEIKMLSYSERLSRRQAREDSLGWVSKASVP